MSIEPTTEASQRAPAREVWITGIGLATSLGEGAEAHLLAIGGGPRLDTERFKPYAVHPAVALNWEQQIPKKADQRQMEAWQKLGVYAAGLALADAGLKDDKDRLSRMDMVVAAGGGERDYAVDGQILTDLPKAADQGAFLNERLMNDLRPTLFLAQLSNLLAGNISIVHGVTGGTRTFMGEEQAGVDSVRIATARIAAGQGDSFLVGGAYNAERPDILLIYEMGGFLWSGEFASVWDRPGAGNGGGFIPGSGAAFLVLEAADTARARGAQPIARLDAVAADLTRRMPGSIDRSLGALWDTVSTGVAPVPADKLVVFSGATGIAGCTEEESGAISRLAPGARVQATGDLFGHMLEAQFPAGVALAAAALAGSPLQQAVVTSVGHMRGEGIARLSKVG